MLNLSEIFSLKFDTLLATYLYQKKKLDLPGIGTFEVDNPVYVDDENEKQKPPIENITFHNATITKADDDLIKFIGVQTGKMKPLAISDLESFLTLGKQFLYMGKPFYLEGIGTLHLTKDGRFQFIPGESITIKLDDPNVVRSEEKKIFARRRSHSTRIPFTYLKKNIVCLRHTGNFRADWMGSLLF